MPADYFVIDAGCNLTPDAAQSRNWQQSYTDGLVWTSSDSFGPPQMQINERDALGYSPVFAGMSLIAGDISGMPWKLKRREADDDIVDAENHPTFNLLYRKSGETDTDVTANLLVECLVMRAIFYGLGCARIHRGAAGFRPSRLELIRTPVTPVDRGRFSKKKFRFYEYTDEHGTLQQLRPDEVFVLPGPALDAFNGMGLYDVAKASLRAAVAAGRYTAEFFEGKGVPKGFFETDQTMSDAAQDRFVRNMDTFMSQRRNYSILEEGLKWKPSGIRPVDALMVDLLQLSEADVARFLKLPPSKLGLGGGTKGTGGAPAKTSEQETRTYLSSCLYYWIDRLQREANDKLVTEAEKRTHFSLIDYKPFLKRSSSAKEAAEAARIDVLTGLSTIDEKRLERGENKHKDGKGALVLLPLNMTTDPAELGGSDGNDGQGGASQPARSQSPAGLSGARESVIQCADTGQTLGNITRALQNVLDRDARRAAKRLGTFAAKAAKKPSGYIARIDALRDDHGAAVRSILAPGCEALAEVLERDGTTTIELIADAIFDEAARRFMDAADCQPEELISQVAAACGDFESTAGKMALSFCEG